MLVCALIPTLLKTGPHNFGFSDRPDWVEHFSYQPGLLVSYWDTSQSDNNTSQHPGAGLVLPVDAHPAPIYRIDGKAWRSRVQVYDAPFSLQRAPSMTLHVAGRRATSAASRRADVRRPHVLLERGRAQSSVKVPNASVRMRVLNQKGTTLELRIDSTR